MTLGFVGAGAIASAIVTGLKSEEDSGYDVVLSPRNAERAADLSRRFGGVSVAGSNQEVVDACETVVIAVRPQIAREALAELRFRPEHNVISVVSGLPVRKLSELAHPAGRVSRAVPLPSVARRRCPTAIYPHDPESEKLFSRLGAAFAVDTEREFEVLCSATSTVASYFGFANAIAGWMTRQGIREAQAREYLGQVLGGVADETVENPGRGFLDLAADHATRGGTNEQLLACLKSRGVFESIAEGLDTILHRVAAAD